MLSSFFYQPDQSEVLNVNWMIHCKTIGPMNIKGDLQEVEILATRLKKKVWTIKNL